MAKHKIDAVEMTRRIREAHQEQLKDKPAAERIEYYRRKSDSLMIRIEKVIQDLIERRDAAS